MSSAEFDPERHAREAYDENGVDRTLVRAALALSPAERLAALEDRLRAYDDLLAARRQSGPDD